MDYNLSTVSLDRIQTDNHTFRITTSVDKPDLSGSIAAVGLLQPPVLLPVDGGFITVCGFRRIAACLENHQTRITARLLPDASSWAACADIAIIDNTSQRPLNIVEQSRAITLIGRYAAMHPGEASRLADLSGLPTGKRAKNRIAPVASMPSSLQHAILEGSVALPVALRIDRLPADDATSICDFFRLINTGLNVQRELLELICDISQREDTQICQLIQTAEVTAILKDTDAPMPQRVHGLRQLFKNWRFPELSTAEARFHKRLKSLKLAPNVQLLPPPFFEGTNFRLTLTVNSKRQLRAARQQIDKLADHPELFPD
ncbi:MAG: hypothetical protein CSA23_02570 [Deltaproteobacteria bacterium]|nr:MAG: hypothetical protein CSA23_02570 [Deltaproteobacteria bacterium]